MWCQAAQMLKLVTGRQCLAIAQVPQGPCEVFAHERPNDFLQWSSRFGFVLKRVICVLSLALVQHQMHLFFLEYHISELGDLRDKFT